MFLLLALLATLILFDIDINYRYASGTSVVWYQALAALAVIVNAVLAMPSARWGRQIADWCSNRAGRWGTARPWGRGAIAVTFAVALAGGILVARGPWRTIPRVFRAPVTIATDTWPLGLLRQASLRIDEGESPYREPYEMVGWTTRLPSMPWMISVERLAEGLGLDFRFLSLLALAATGWVGVLLALTLAEAWREGRAGPGALVGAVGLVAAAGLWSSSLASRTFVLREPVAIVWPFVAIFFLAAGRRAWAWAGAMLGVCAGLYLPLILLAPVFFAGVHGERKAESVETGKEGAALFPSIPLAVFLAVFIVALSPHLAELGVLARGVIETPFSAARYLAETHQLGTQPGLAYWMNITGLIPLLPIIAIIVIGEISHRAIRKKTKDPARLLRLLALSLFLLALLSPMPSNKVYWPYLAALLVVGGFQTFWETALRDENAREGSPGNEMIRRSRQTRRGKGSGGILIPALGLAVAVGVVASMAWRIWEKPRTRTLEERTSTESWSGRSLAIKGFRPPEDDQLWMDGRSGLINLPVIHPHDGILKFKLSVVASKIHETNGLTIDLNGRTVFATTLPTGTLNVVDVPLDRRDFVVGPNTLILRAEWADSPANMGIEGNDQRILSFGYYGFQWQPKSSP